MILTIINPVGERWSFGLGLDAEYIARDLAKHMPKEDLQAALDQVTKLNHAPLPPKGQSALSFNKKTKWTAILSNP